MRKVDEVSGEIVDAALKVHSALGPGLLESAYEACLSYELRARGHDVETQVPQPVVYGDVKLEAGYRIDMVVDSVVVVELKCVESVLGIHKAQLLTYLRLSGKPVGLLLNFHVGRMKEGIHRMVL